MSSSRIRSGGSKAPQSSTKLQRATTIDDASAIDIERRQARLKIDLDTILAKRSARPLPRPLRVLRKHLRGWGLWPDLQGLAPAGPDSWAGIRKAAPKALAPYFSPLSRYEAWQAVNRFTPAARRDLEAALADSTDLPTVSILLPVHDTPVVLLEAALRSMREQVYKNWELCIADDASSSEAVQSLLARAAAADPRVKLTRLDQNGGISQATNAAAALASGEVLVFLDHDDLLTPDCLGEIALYYANNPQADLVYSDDDKISDKGERFAPQFKPDWSPALLLSYMYMSHVLTVRRSLFEALGGFRKAFDGSQDYDFALRATERARAIGHIPRVLYHWRATAGSTASSGAAKPHSFDAGRRAVSEALERRGIVADVVQPDWAVKASVGMFSLRFPDTGPSVTIIIPTYNRPDLLSACVASLQATTYANHDILIIDNGSDTPAAMECLKGLEGKPGLRILRIPQRLEGFSYSALMNEAVTHVDSEFIVFLNDDTTIITPHWLSQMVGYGLMEGVGAVGARLYFADGTIQHAGIVNGFNEGLVGHAFRGAAGQDWGYMGFVRTAREYASVTGACMLTRKRIFESFAGFDEDNFAVAYNDVDYGFRLAEAGLRCVYCPEAEFFHLEGQSRGFRDNPREVVALRQKWGGWRDPWYNPNLTLDNESFEVEARRAPMRSRRPVRVVAVSHNLKREGAPNTLFDLLVGLKSSGVAEVVVLAPQDGPLRAEYEAAGIKVQIFLQPAARADIESYQLVRDALTDQFQSLKAEVVIANTLTTYYAVDAAHRAGIGAIWCQHESEPWQGYFNDLHPKVRSRAYAAFGQAYRVTYVADATRKAWTGVQTRHNAQLIRHGIPIDRLAAEVSRWSRAGARSHLGLQGEDLVFILIGTVCRRKGQLDLVQALSLMSAQDAARLRFLVVGFTSESDYGAELAYAIGSLPVELAARIDVVGPVDDMTPYYAAADVFICTSRVESAPRVLVEAMAFGLPIITTPVFGIPELVDENVNALFYSPGDLGVLRDLILELAGSEQRRDDLAVHSRDVLASRPGYADMVASYATLIREAALIQDDPGAAQGRILGHSVEAVAPR